MKYLFVTIFSLLCVDCFCENNVINLKDNSVVLVKEYDTLSAEKYKDIFYIPINAEMIISKVLLSDTAKNKYPFTVTSNQDIVAQDDVKKYCDKQFKIVPKKVYSIHWGMFDWKICFSNKPVLQYDLIFADVNHVAIGGKQAKMSEGYFELNDTVCVKNVKFPQNGLLIVTCDNDTIIKKEVKESEENFNLTLYKGKSYVFTLEGLLWAIGNKMDINDLNESGSLITGSWVKGFVLGIMISFIFFVLSKKRKKILRILSGYKIKKTIEKKTVKYRSKDGSFIEGYKAFPNGFHSFDDGLSIVVENGFIKLVFPIDESEELSCIGDKDLKIKCKDSDIQIGNIAYPDGVFISDGREITVKDYKITNIKNKPKETPQNISEVKKQPTDISKPEEKKVDNWRDAFTEETKQQLNSVVDRNIMEDCDSCDDLCKTLASLLLDCKKNNASQISVPTKHTQNTPQYSEERFVKNLIDELSKKSNVREYCNSKELTIGNKSQLIDFVDSLVKQKKKNVYTLEELAKMAKSTLTSIDENVKSKVFDIYVIYYLRAKFNLGWTEKTILSNAIKGLIVMKSEADWERKALDLIGDKIESNFDNLDDFASKWSSKTTPQVSQTKDDNSQLIERLQKITGSNKIMISELLDDLENLKVTSIENEVTINGKNVEEIKQDLISYDEIKYLSEFTKLGKTVDEVRNAISENAKNEGKADIVSAVSKAVNEAVPDKTEFESFKNLKKLIENIIKADSEEKLTNAMALISDVVKDMQFIEGEKNKASQEKNTTLSSIMNNIKSQYYSILKKEFNVEDGLTSEKCLNAINQFAKLVGKEISDLNGRILDKENIISNQGNEIKTLCEDYSNLIVNTFKQIENDLNKACENAKESDALSNRFRQRVISNDAFNVEDFMTELKDVFIKPETVHNDVKKALHDLLLTTVQGNSWVQTLSHIYLYIQHPAVAAYFVENKINISNIIASFVMTEQMLRALGIELHYPMLFEDIYDSNLYDESTLSDVKDYVNDIKELVGDRQSIIIDMFRLGYTSNGETHKAKVTRFN